jgi:predicted amidohydrolase
MRVGFFQFSPRFGDVDGNLERIVKAVQGCGADLLVAPELSLSGYLFRARQEVERLSEPLPGPSSERLAEAARAADCHLVVGMAEKAGGKLFNSAVLFGPGGIVGVYRKAHLFNEEKVYFSPGDGDFPVFQAAGARIGLLVCFDHMFPEAARTLALRGAEIICHPSNLVLPEYGQLTTRVRSIENRVFWILANRCGSEQRGGESLTYSGSSQIVSSDGRVLVRGPERGDALEVAEIDPQRARDKKVTARNDLFEDRRPAIYRLD